MEPLSIELQNYQQRLYALLEANEQDLTKHHKILSDFENFIVGDDFLTDSHNLSSSLEEVKDVVNFMEKRTKQVTFEGLRCIQMVLILLDKLQGALTIDFNSCEEFQSIPVLEGDYFPMSTLPPEEPVFQKEQASSTYLGKIIAEPVRRHFSAPMQSHPFPLASSPSRGLQPTLRHPSPSFIRPPTRLPPALPDHLSQSPSNPSPSTSPRQVFIPSVPSGMPPPLPKEEGMYRTGSVGIADGKKEEKSSEKKVRRLSLKNPIKGKIEKGEKDEQEEAEPKQLRETTSYRHLPISPGRDEKIKKINTGRQESNISRPPLEDAETKHGKKSGRTPSIKERFTRSPKRNERSTSQDFEPRDRDSKEVLTITAPVKDKKLKKRTSKEEPERRTSRSISLTARSPRKSRIKPNTSEEAETNYVRSETGESEDQNLAAESVLAPETKPDPPVPQPRLPSLIVPNSYPSLRIDEPVEEIMMDRFELDVVEDLYRTIYFTNVHHNFIVTDFNNTDHYVVTVMEKAIEGINPPLHRALRITHKGHKELLLQVPAENTLFLDRLHQAVIREEKDRPVQYVASSQMSYDLLEIEKNHSQVRTSLKIGIIYCKPGQTDPREMFQNGRNGDECSESFWKFVELLGKEIELEGWEGYRGDFGADVQGKTYFENWNNIQIMYHVAPMMDAEGHRRLIGNDVAIIFFLEKGKLSLSNVSSLGTVPQIYAIVKPTKTGQYKMASFCNINIKPYLPSVPAFAVDPVLLKLLLLTKLHNGIVMTSYCPPLARLFFLPRKETLESIIAKHVTQERKPKKKLTKQQLIMDHIVEEGWIKGQISLVPLTVALSPQNQKSERDVLVRVTTSAVIVIDFKTRQKIYEWDLSIIHKLQISDSMGSKTLVVLVGARPDQVREAFLIKTMDAKKIENLILEGKKQMESKKHV